MKDSGWSWKLAIAISILFCAVTILLIKLVGA